MTTSTFTDMPTRSDPPNKAVRVLPIEILATFMRDWQNFMDGIDSTGPRLTRPGSTQVFVTDPESVFLCTDVDDFGVRLGVGYPTAVGCGVIFFDPEGFTIRVPAKAPEATQDGLTSGGAREWIIDGNPALELSRNELEVFEVESSGQRRGPVT